MSITEYEDARFLRALLYGECSTPMPAPPTPKLPPYTDTEAFFDRALGLRPRGVSPSQRAAKRAREEEDRWVCQMLDKLIGDGTG